MPKPPSDVPNRQVTPPPELEKRTRRRFSTAEKLRILDEADGSRRARRARRAAATRETLQQSAAAMAPRTCRARRTGQD